MLFQLETRGLVLYLTHDCLTSKWQHVKARHVWGQCVCSLLLQMFKVSAQLETWTRNCFNAIMCLISTSVQRDDPYSQKIWQLQALPIRSPSPILRELRGIHTHSGKGRSSPPWPSAKSQTYTVQGKAGCEEIWERHSGNATHRARRVN